MSGEPPYRVHYSVQHGTSKPVKKTKTVRLSREELELRPEAIGEFTYQFISIDDANYNDIEIGRTVKQTVHPLAGVSFSNAGKGQKVWSCEGDDIQVPIELKVREYIRPCRLAPSSNSDMPRLSGNCALACRLPHCRAERCLAR